MKNYYKILGITADAEPDEIQHAYDVRLQLQEKFPQSYNEELKQDIDDAYHTLIDSNARAEHDVELRKFEVRQQSEELENAANNGAEEKKSSVMQFVERWSVAIILIFVVLTIRVLAGDAIQDMLNPGTSSNDTDTLAAILPAEYIPVGTIDAIPLTYRGTVNTDTSFYFNRKKIMCVGEARRDTYAYGRNLLVLGELVPAGAQLVFRVHLPNWLELVDSEYGDLFEINEVKNIKCFKVEWRPNVTPTPPPAADVAGRRCYLRNRTDSLLRAYVSKDIESADAGRILQGATFYGVSDGEWFAVTAATTHQLDGFIPASQVDVLHCAYATVTPVVSEPDA